MTDPIDTTRTDETQEIRQQVGERVAEEEALAVEKEDGDSKGNGKISSKFIRECMLQCDAGDGLLYSRVNKGKLVYNAQSGQWLRWAGHSWTDDTMEEHKTAVEDVVDVLLEETSRLSWRIQGALKEKNNGLA